jgi:uncharacterized protein YacL
MKKLMNRIWADSRIFFAAVGGVIGLIVTSSIGIAGSIMMFPVALGGLLLSLLGAVAFGAFGWLIGENRRLRRKK